MVNLSTNFKNINLHFFGKHTTKESCYMVDTIILVLPVPKGSFSCEIVIVIPSCKKEKKKKIQKL